MSTYVAVSKCIANNLQAPNPPKSITITKAGKSETYTRTYLSYNYGTPERPYLSEALFELKICKGKVKRNKKGEIKLNLSITNMEDLAGLSQLSLGFAYIVHKYKNQYGLHKFDPQNPGDLRGSFFYPVAEGTGEIIEGASAIVSLKMNEKTKFKVLTPKVNPETKEPLYDEMDAIDEQGNRVFDEQGNKVVVRFPAYEETNIDYKVLLDKQIDCSVVINPRDMYRSMGTPLPQIFVRSCLVLSVSDSGEVEHAKGELVRKYLQQNPEMLNSLAEQIAKLKVGESLLQTADVPKTGAPPADLPTAQALASQSTST